MTDFEKLAAMLDKAGIGWVRHDLTRSGMDEGSFVVHVGDDRDSQLSQPYDGGYIGFYTEIAFGPDGSLLAVWAYE